MWLERLDKIYTRKRLRLPKIQVDSKYNTNNKIEKKKIKKLIKVVLILSIAFFILERSLKLIEPKFTAMCEEKAKGIATKISNNEASEIMKKYEYEDLVTVTKDDSGNVKLVKSNIVPINKIVSDIGVEIQEELDKLSYQDIEIKLGTLLGSKLLVGRGPNIKLRITERGDVITDYRSEFSAAGINQTLHRVYLNVQCNMRILTPYNIIDEKIENQVILIENVIVGTTPDTYYNFDNLTNGEAAMETIE